MKKIYSIVAALVLTLNVFAQAPEKMSYQAVIRDAGNTLVTSQAVGMQISILQGSISGTAVYVETQTPTSNINGLVSVEIGSGTVVSGTFNTIDWSAGPYFVKTESDPTGGSTYTITGTSQLMSVPYALYAKTSGSSTPGPQGATGPQGAAGTNGTDGAVGATGATGPQGPQGPIGLTGATGPQGAAGTDGAVGATGATGAQGPIGLTGATGPQGAAGNDGATGPQGPAGTDGQGGVTTAGSGINVTGAGTVASPYVVSTTSPCGLAIGQTYQGGIIFYLDASGCHGLVAAPTDQSIPPGAAWHDGSDKDTRAYGSGLFEGKYNTYMIYRVQSGLTSAAAICQNLILGGYNDWYLPSIEELNKMCQNIGQVNVLGLGNVGGFANTSYWSSTEYDNKNYYSAWRQNFNDGYQRNNDKYITHYVRAVRAF